MGAVKYNALRKKKGGEEQQVAKSPVVAVPVGETVRKVGAKSATSPTTTHNKNNNSKRTGSGGKKDPTALPTKRQRLEEKDEDADDLKEGDFVSEVPAPKKGEKSVAQLEAEDPINLDSDSDDEYLNDEPPMEEGDDQLYDEEASDVNVNPVVHSSGSKKKSDKKTPAVTQQEEVPAKNKEVKESLAQRKKKEEALAKMKTKKDTKDLTIVSKKSATPAEEKKLSKKELKQQKLEAAPAALTPQQIIAKVAFGKKNGPAALAANSKGPQAFDDTTNAKASASAKKLLDQVVKLSSAVPVVSNDKKKKDYDKQKKEATKKKQEKKEGGSDDDADHSDDGSELGEDGAAFIKQYLTQRIEQNAGSAGNPELLMKEANQFFEEHSKEEKNRTKTAMKRLKEMRDANKRGGDKDGFRYVVPKNHKELLRVEALKSGQSLGPGEDGSEDKLDSHFMGDGVDETDKKPVRKNKRKPYFFDDFYEFQKVKKWTDRAETFLQKTRFAKQAKHVRMTGQRNINKM